MLLPLKSPLRFSLPPVMLAALIHLACSGVLWLAASQMSQPLPSMVWMLAEGCAAAALGHYAGLPRWWLPINVLFVPAAAMLSAMSLPPAAYFAAFCALLLTNTGAWRSRVPLFVSSSQASRALATLLPRRALRVVDLGCGTGSLLTSLARSRPDSQYFGVELAPLNYLLSRWHAKNEKSVSVRWGSFWHVDLAGYDVVYAYLSPVPMAALWQKARREMRPGSLFVSNGFIVPDVPPAQTIELGDRVSSKLYVWWM